ncbi:hypothetical protein ACFTS5_10940 [Nocardia sp. NPDC056952]|uniref:hypothetical protein n=1 Tax=Nocardia sp. NPDC056952 TaxID=3345979 RepID=UPI00362567D1
MTLAFDPKNEVVSKTLTGGNLTAHVDPSDVESYLELVEAGMLPSTPCAGFAVQDNISLRHDTRTPLARKA